MNSTPEGSRPEAKGLGCYTPTCIIFGYHPTPSWRKGHWRGQLPSTKGSPEKLAAVHPSKRVGAPAEGWVSLLVQRVGGRRDQYLLYGATHT